MRFLTSLALVLCLSTSASAYVVPPAVPSTVISSVSTSVAGDLYYASSNGTMHVLHIGSNAQCLTVAASMPTWASCGGGGGGPTLSGTNAWTGTNNYGAIGTNNPALIGISQGAGGSAGLTTLGADASQTCGIVADTTTGANFGIFDPANGPLILEDAGGSKLAVCFRLYADGGTYSQGYTDTTGNSASMFLGQTGAPSGACINGSLWTRSEGSVGADLYVCYGTTWHASAT